MSDDIKEIVVELAKARATHAALSSEPRYNGTTGRAIYLAEQRLDEFCRKWCEENFMVLR